MITDKVIYTALLIYNLSVKIKYKKKHKRFNNIYLNTTLKFVFILKKLYFKI